MSIANRIKFIQENYAGIPSYMAELAALRMVQGVGEVDASGALEEFQTNVINLRDEVSAVNDRFDQDQALRAKLANYEIPATESRYLIFYDENTIIENGTGLTPDSPIKNFEALSKHFHPRLHVEVFCYSHVTVNHVVFMRNCPAKIEFVSQADPEQFPDGPNFEIVDALNNPNFAGGFFLYSPNGMDIEVNNFNTILNYNVARSPVEVVRGRIQSWMRGGTLSRTGNSQRPLFGGVFSAHFSVIGTVVDPSASGFVIQGVASGGDPNDIPGISANFAFG